MGVYGYKPSPRLKEKTRQATSKIAKGASRYGILMHQMQELSSHEESSQ